MDESLLRAARLAAFALAAAVAVVLQRALPHAGVGGSRRVNLGLWVLDLAVMGTVCGACACAVAGWAAARGTGILRAAATPDWLALLVTVVALDLVSYVWHRANHALAPLWRFHQVHHSDARFTVSTGLRFHPGELLLSLPLRLLAVGTLGPPVLAVVVFEALFTLANLIEHGDIGLPPRLERALGRVLVTPALHRRHHGVLAAQHGTNFGTILTSWDRLLGTYAPSDARTRVTIGLPELPAPATVRQALALPLRSRRG